jgi:hypothetical protein
MISSESKTIIDDREAFAELCPKTLARSTCGTYLTQQRYARTIGDRKTEKHSATMATGSAYQGVRVLADFEPRRAIFQAVDRLPSQIVSLSSWLQSGHRKIRISEPPPGIGTIEIRCISTLQRQSGNSVEPVASTRSNFDMTRVGVVGLLKC